MIDNLRKAIAEFRSEGLNEITISMLLKKAGIKTPSPIDAPAFNKLLDELASEGAIYDLSNTNEGWGYSLVRGFPSYSVGVKIKLL